MNALRMHLRVYGVLQIARRHPRMFSRLIGLFRSVVGDIDHRADVFDGEEDRRVRHALDQGA
jgi:hypothetical protein